MAADVGSHGNCRGRADYNSEPPRSKGDDAETRSRGESQRFYCVRSHRSFCASRTGEFESSTNRSSDFWQSKRRHAAHASAIRPSELTCRSRLWSGKTRRVRHGCRTMIRNGSCNGTAALPELGIRLAPFPMRSRRLPQVQHRQSEGSGTPESYPNGVWRRRKPWRRPAGRATSSRH